MINRDPVSVAEAQPILKEIRTNGRLHIFSGIMNASHVYKVTPFPNDPALFIYHINYLYDEHAIAVGPDSMFWLSRSPIYTTAIYHEPHVSTWYFLTIAPRQLSVYDTALVLSLGIPPRPANALLLTHPDDIPPLPDPPPYDRLPGVTIDGQAERLQQLIGIIQPPVRIGRIFTFYVWQQEYGQVYRFRVLIDGQSQRLIIARHPVMSAVGDLTFP